MYRCWPCFYHICLLFCSSANAKKWEIELATLKSNNARLTAALQESTANVDEWKRQLHSYKEENMRMKAKYQADLENSKGNFILRLPDPFPLHKYQNYQTSVLLCNGDIWFIAALENGNSCESNSTCNICRWRWNSRRAAQRNPILATQGRATRGRARGEEFWAQAAYAVAQNVRYTGKHCSLIKVIVVSNLKQKTVLNETQNYSCDELPVTRLSRKRTKTSKPRPSWPNQN